MNQSPRSHTGHHNVHSGHSEKMFAVRFWVCLILTLPVVWFSGLIQNALNISFILEEWMMYVSPIASLIIFAYGGIPFIAGFVREIQKRRPGMMTLISIAIITAFTYSTATLLTGSGEALWWELATLITIMLLGHWVEMKAVSGVRSSLEEIARLVPDTAEVVRKNGNAKLPVSELRNGDLVIVRPGSQIPVDGLVLEGSSRVSEALITGESTPVIKKDRSAVIAGSINGDGTLIVRVEKTGEKTFVAGVMRLVKEAQESKSNLQLLADRAALILTVVAITTSLVTLASWLLLSNPSYALERMVAVLVVACPHALGLAIPLVAARATSIAAKNSILVRERSALESARNISIVAFDKTGTLTMGNYSVKQVTINPIAKKSETEVLRFAASINDKSEHFIAKAITQEVLKRDIKLKKVNNFERIPGKGVTGIVGESIIIVGGERVLKDKNISLSKKVEQDISMAVKRGETVVYVIENDILIGVITLGDVIRREAREAVEMLSSSDITTVMLTGDSYEVAQWVGREVGIKDIYAKTLPEDKSKKIMMMQKKGVVAMVGDGINDAPALTQADVGIAIGTGTNVAIESAGILLVKNDPRDVVNVIKLSRATYRKMMQNLLWAVGYNVITIPLAAGVFSSFGWVMTPAISAVTMSISTVVVAINAGLLRLPLQNKLKAL